MGSFKNTEECPYDMGRLLFKKNSNRNNELIESNQEILILWKVLPNPTLLGSTLLINFIFPITKHPRMLSYSDNTPKNPTHSKTQKELFYPTLYRMFFFFFIKLWPNNNNLYHRDFFPMKVKNFRNVLSYMWKTEWQWNKLSKVSQGIRANPKLKFKSN